MNNETFIAAVELGSSRLSAIAGRRDPDGIMRVLAYVSTPSASFIRKGCVYNVDKAAQALTSVIHSLQDRLQATVARVYVGIGGLSMHTVMNRISRTADTGIITRELTDSLGDENLTYPLQDMDIVDVVPQEYDIDHHLYTEPAGVTGHSITGTYLNIVASAILKRNLTLSFDRAGIQIADLLTTPLCLAHILLTEGERHSGCVLVDLGAGTTTVQVYKAGILRHLCVLPLGGDNLTRDVAAGLQLDEDEAEALKLHYGDALGTDGRDAGTPLPVITAADGRTLDPTRLDDLISARAEEILANVWQQIRLSGYEDRLPAGIILTGGTASLPHVGDLLLRLGKATKVRTATLPAGLLRDCPDEIASGSLAYTLPALLLAGTENCCLQQPPRPADIFSDDAELRAQAEENRRRKEEEDRRKKDEGKKQRKDKDRNKTPGNDKPNWFRRRLDNFTEELFGEKDDKM